MQEVEEGKRALPSQEERTETPPISYPELLMTNSPLAQWVKNEREHGRDPMNDETVQCLALASRIEGLQAVSGGRRPGPSWATRLDCANAILKDRGRPGGAGQGPGPEEGPAIGGSVDWAKENAPGEGEG